MKTHSSQRELQQQEVIKKIAYQLYQDRTQAKAKGDQTSDWEEAQKIAKNPIKWSLYFARCTVRTVTAPPKRWFISGISNKTSWEWMELLIIPLFLTIGAFHLESRVRSRQEKAVSERYAQEARIADNMSKQATLTSYLEKMEKLLLEKNLRTSLEDSEVRSVARAITIATIKNLDSERNNLLLSFLRESNLVQTTKEGSISLFSSLNLSNVDLSNVDFSGVNFREANLRGANLKGANLSKANLIDADIREANLSGTDLSGANLSNASLSGADLSEAFLSGADLSGASLIGTNLSDAFLEAANLNDAYLSQADLGGAYLFDAGLNEEQINNANLCGTFLPQGFTTNPNRNCDE